MFASHIRENEEIIDVLWDSDTEEGKITVMARGIGGCESEVKEYVVDIRSSFLDLGLNKEICKGESITISAGEEYENYLWQDSSRQSYYIADSTGTYWVTVTNTVGCSDTDSVDLTVHDNPELNIEVSSPLPENAYLDEDSIAFYAWNADYITLDAGIWNSYEWSNGDIMSSLDIEVNEFSARQLNAKTEEYWVTVSNEFGCQSTDSITVTIIEGLQIPNAISPNGDGIHDAWRIAGLKNHANCRIEIYDRWGNMVYYSNDYKEGHYWDGTHQNGKKLPMDSYYYIIHLGNDQQPIHGVVSILR